MNINIFLVIGFKIDNCISCKYKVTAIAKLPNVRMAFLGNCIYNLLEYNRPYSKNSSK